VLGPALVGALVAIGGLAIIDDRFIPGRVADDLQPEEPAARLQQTG